MIHFVVHDENDSVGVVVVEGVKAGDRVVLAPPEKLRDGATVALLKK